MPKMVTKAARDEESFLASPEAIMEGPRLPPAYGGDFYPEPGHWVSGLCTVFACALHVTFGLPMFALVEEAEADGHQTVVHAFCLWEGKAVDGLGIRECVPAAEDYAEPGTSIYYEGEPSTYKIIPVSQEQLQELHHVEDMSDIAAAVWFIQNSGRFETLLSARTARP